MKFNLWTNYGALNSKPIFDAFANGAKSLGHDVVWNDSNSDVDVIWSVLFHGRMAKNKDIWERNVAQSKPTIVIEVGGIERGVTWKVGLGGINRDANFGPKGNDSTRADKFGLIPQNWKNGQDILLCGQHDKSLQWKNMPSMSNWVMTTIEEIRKHTDRRIIFRPHPRSPLPHIEKEFKNVIRQEPKHIPGTYDNFDMRFDNIHALVNWSSNPGPQAVIKGIPVFVGISSLAYDVGNDIDFMHDIENPLRPDRQQWLNDYAWTEFTVNEISQGLPINRLTSELI